MGGGQDGWPNSKCIEFWMKWFDFKPLLDHLVVFLDKTLRTKGKAVCLTTKAYITLIRILLFIGGHHFSHIVTGVIGYNCTCYGLSFI